MKELQEQLAHLTDRIERGLVVLKVGEKEERIEQLDKLAAAPGFWQYKEEAARVMQEREQLQAVAGVWRGMGTQTEGLQGVLKLEGARIRPEVAK